jgi:hypothetical protein
MIRRSKTDSNPLLPNKEIEPLIQPLYRISSKILSFHYLLNPIGVLIKFFHFVPGLSPEAHNILPLRGNETLNYEILQLF